MSTVIRVEVTAGDVMTHEADVLALKHAQALYGVDLRVVERLREAGIDISEKLPSIGQSLIVGSAGVVRAPQVLFRGVPPLGLFEYREIRQFAADVLHELAVSMPAVRYLAMTLHGRGFGLDEAEAFRAEVAGLLDAFGAGGYPAALEMVTIVEKDRRTAARLAYLLDTLLPSRHVIPGRSQRTDRATADARAALESVGDASKAKPHVFVAMPFASEFDDRFHYGIRNAVNSAGYLCERADLASFTGDVIDWVRERIDNASLLVADLSTANPNVYLEVGYAWGRGVRTVLLSPSASEVKFNVRGQRCLVFNSIRHLEEILTRELAALRADGYPSV